MKFTAVGDLLIQRRFPGDYVGFEDVKQYIAKGDFRFCNLETTVNREGECFGNQACGGSYLRVEPENLNYLTEYGFNAVNAANNHALDYAHNGLIKTMEYIRAAGFEPAGIGENLSRAASPVYIDTPNGRVALIGISSVISYPTQMAGEQGKRIPGRPGVNGLRAEKRYTVSKEDIEALVRIGEETYANAHMNVLRSEGYRPSLPENCVAFDDIIFEEGDKHGKKYIINKNDIVRMEKSIFEAKLQADYIFVSVHVHEQKERKEDVPEFLVEFSKKCIDLGADGIIGHGPHLLRGIEIYNGKPIFYSLGDFVLQNENTQFMPEDYYEKFGLTSSETMHKLFEIRSKGFTRGISSDIRMFETVIPYWEMEGGKLTHLELMPVLLTFDVPRSRYGMPQIAKDKGIIEKIAELSVPFGTKITIKDGIGICEL